MKQQKFCNLAVCSHFLIIRTKIILVCILFFKISFSLLVFKSSCLRFYPLLLLINLLHAVRFLIHLIFHFEAFLFVADLQMLGLYFVVILGSLFFSIHSMGNFDTCYRLIDLLCEIDHWFCQYFAYRCLVLLVDLLELVCLGKLFQLVWPDLNVCSNLQIFRKLIQIINALIIPQV